MCHVQLAGRLHCFAAGDGKAGIDVKASRAESVVFPPAERSSSSEYQQLMDHITLSSYPHLHLLAYLRVILFLSIFPSLYLFYFTITFRADIILPRIPFLPSPLCACLYSLTPPGQVPPLCYAA